MYRHNMQILHWKATGVHFNEIHSLCDEYTFQLGRYIDSVAEKLIMLEQNPLSICDCVGILSQDNHHHYLQLDPNETYCNIEAYRAIEVMFTDIMSAYNAVLFKVTMDPGMKSSMESELEWFELECRYKNKQRLHGHECNKQ